MKREALASLCQRYFLNYGVEKNEAYPIYFCNHITADFIGYRRSKNIGCEYRLFYRVVTGK